MIKICLILTNLASQKNFYMASVATATGYPTVLFYEPNLGSGLLPKTLVSVTKQVSFLVNWDLI